MKKWIIVTICLIGSLSLWSQSNSVDQIKQYMNELHKNDLLMGAVSIYEKGKPVMFYAVGETDLSKHSPITAQTKFRIGSVSKTITAVMVMQAIEQNKLRLDDTLSKYYPTIKNADQITIQHLLQHRSGIFNITNDPAFQGYYMNPITESEWIEKISAKVSTFKPGTKYQYSNSNYILLSLILQKIYQKPFEQILTEKMVRPNGLKDQMGLMKKATEAINESSSYSWDADSLWIKQKETDASIPLGAGAIVSTLDGLNQFFWKYFNGKMVKASTIQQMQQVQDKVGLGIFVDTIGEKVFWGHGGAIDGFRTQVYYNQETGISIAVSLNATLESVEKVASNMLKMYLGWEVEREILQLKVDPSWGLEKMAGEYSTEKLPLDITIRVKHGYFSMQAKGQPAFILKPVSPKKLENKTYGVYLEINEAGDGFTVKQGSFTLEYKRKGEQQ